MQKIYVILIFFLVVSCGKIPETRYFTLDYEMETTLETESKEILFVKNFQSDPIYNNDKMIYKVSDYEIKFDNYRRWVLTPSDLLTMHAVEYLRHTGQFAWVTTLLPRHYNYWILDGRVVNFEEQIKQGNRIVNVGIVFTLMRDNSDQILYTDSVNAHVEITGSGAEGIAQAMSQATRQVLQTLSGQIDQLDPFNRF